MPAQPPSALEWNDYLRATSRIAVKYLPTHGDFPAHDHAFVEIAVITTGTCLHRSVLGDSKAGPGDVFLFRPGAWHAYAETRDLALYNCYFDTGLLGRELHWMADDPCLGRLLWGIPLSPKQHGMVCLHLPRNELVRCCAHLDALRRLGRGDYTMHHGEHVGLLILLLSLLARNTPANSQWSFTPHRAVTATLKLIDDSPTENWTLKGLASHVHVAPNYFVRLFREAVGLPPMAYLKRRRLELVANLLRRDHVTVGEAAAMAGWLDANYFSRCFRNHYGTTPSEYRARVLCVRKRSAGGVPASSLAIGPPPGASARSPSTQ